MKQYISFLPVAMSLGFLLYPFGEIAIPVHSYACHAFSAQEPPESSPEKVNFWCLNIVSLQENHISSSGAKILNNVISCRNRLVVKRDRSTNMPLVSPVIHGGP